MKTKILLIVSILMAFSIFAFAQVKVTPKKITYNRPKTVENEYKRKFTINYPVVSGANGKKIETILSYAKNFEFNLKEQQSGKDFWLDSADFKVNYNKNNILDIELSVEGSGAYPSTSIKYFVINSKTATKLKAADVFTNVNGLVAKCRILQKFEQKKALEEISKDPDSADFDTSEYFSKKFSAEDLNIFSVGNNGVTFHFDYGFPHVALALQPDGNYLFTWKQLKTYIKSDGLFAQFAK